jgi:hypothetical protein
MNYDQARSKIQTGDMIAVKRTTGLFPIATRIVTNSPYTHTGIAIWAGCRLLLAQTNSGGCNLAPLSQEAIYDFDVFNCPVDRNTCEAVIWNELGNRIEYGFFDCARIFGYKVFCIPLPKRDGKSLVCSALTATIYQKAGWLPPVGFPSIPWPGADVAALQNAMKLEVKATN